MGFGSIKHYGHKIKGYLTGLHGKALHYADTDRGNQVIQALCIVLVGIGSFMIGRNSGIEETRLPITQDISHRITYLEPASKDALQKPRGKVVASRNGKRYHYPWCKGAETISEKNKRWFASEAEAEKAGYTLAGNCK